MKEVQLVSRWQTFLNRCYSKSGKFPNLEFLKIPIKAYKPLVWKSPGHVSYRHDCPHGNILHWIWFAVGFKNAKSNCEQRINMNRETLRILPDVVCGILNLKIWKTILHIPLNLQYKHTKFQKVISRTVLQLSLRNLLKPCVKSRMKT